MFINELRESFNKTLEGIDSMIHEMKCKKVVIDNLIDIQEDYVDTLEDMVDHEEDLLDALKKLKELNELQEGYERFIYELNKERHHWGFY